MPNSNLTRLTRTDPHPPVRVVHLGLGAFFRAHGALYLQEASANSWGIAGVSLRSPTTRDKLAQQDLLYTAVEISDTGLKARTVDALAEVLVALENPEAVLKLMTAETTQMVTMTVTEKGYCRSGAGLEPDLEHPDIVHDLRSDLPRSAPGYLVRALERRWKANIRPFTVVSLDNLPSNGDVTKTIVCKLAEKIDPQLAEWVRSECRFPNSMVDRIVPATTQEFVDRLASQTTVRDPVAVIHEPFRQWVVEDSFVDGIRPDLESAGVQLVSDVEPFEHMKLRMLNGAHSALAYVGSNLGFKTVADAMNDPTLSAFIDALWEEEIIPSLIAPPDTDLSEYAKTLKSRFQNHEIHHLLEQISMDGSQKLPQRILNTLSENVANGRPCKRLCHVVAAWIMFLKKRDRQSINDPLADELSQAVADASNHTEAVSNVLSITSIFGQYTVSDFKENIVNALNQLDELESKQKATGDAS